MTGVDVRTAAPPLVAHVLFHLGTGGLENGVVNLINHMPRDAYRHAIVCVKGSTDFSRRLARDDVSIVTLNKREGIEVASYLRAWRALRALRPSIVHTRNLAALEMQVPALLAGAPIRIHSEHGRDGADLDGRYARYNRLRKAFRPIVHSYVAMSKDLQRWLTDTIAIDHAKVHQIYNGVDTRRFAPKAVDRAAIGPAGFFEGASFVVGAVGRTVTIKDHDTLIRAFAQLHAHAPSPRGLRLVLVGDGPLLEGCRRTAHELGVAQHCWFAGDRSDVEVILRSLDVFCLTSLNEGINNTVLEAMATGLPVVATAVGGNPELVVDGENGRLVPARAPAQLADALAAYVRDEDCRLSHGRAGRRRAELHFSLESMVRGYTRLYDAALSAGAPAAAAAR